MRKIEAVKTWKFGNWLEDLPREHGNSPVWRKQEPEHGVVLHAPKESA